MKISSFSTSLMFSATLKVTTIIPSTIKGGCIACFKGERGASVSYNTIRHNESGQCNFLRTHDYHRPFIVFRPPSHVVNVKTFYSCFNN